MRRRRFLGLMAALPLPGLLAACSGGPGPTPSPSPGPAESPSPGPTPSPRSAAGATPTASPAPATIEPRRRQRSMTEYPVTPGARPHDVAPLPAGGGVWYTGQRNGTLGLLDPATGAVEEVPLGAGSAPHGVIVGPAGHAWVTDGGLNAIVRVDAVTRAVTTFPLPADRPGANLNTATFDHAGVLWFTGQAGVYGRLDPESGLTEVFDAPGGPGPYGICTTPGGEVYYASLAGSHIARVDTRTGVATPIDPPTARQGARRVWADSAGAVWVSEWNAGRVARYEPTAARWTEWGVPGSAPAIYAVYVDELDVVWLTDFGGNSMVAFFPGTEEFTAFPLPGPGAAVRQLLGRPGEVWGAQSGRDALVVVRTE